MWRIIGAVAAGYVAIGVLVVLTDQVCAALIPGFASMTTPPRSYFAISSLTGFLYSIVGGYLCAWIARTRSRIATVGLIIFGEFMGVVSLAMFWKTAPHWYGFALLVIFPPGIWLGSSLYSRLRSGESLVAST
ncbi:MAG: hypothetical protein ACR2I2_23455 [Bryobacteraceae bacterium]